MLTVSDITRALQPVVEPSPFEDGTQVIRLSESAFVPVLTFATMFSDATDITASSLLAVDNEVLGYATHMAEWQQKGYIK